MKKEVKNSQDIAELLKEARLGLGLTVEDMAHKLGCTTQIVYVYEQGKRNFLLSKLCEIMVILKIEQITFNPEKK